MATINQPLGPSGSGPTLELPPVGGPTPPSTAPNPFNPSSPIATNPPSTAPSSVPPSQITPSLPSGATSQLVYPPEMATNGVRIAFSFYKYQKPSVFAPTQFQPTGDFIFLPIPDGIVDQYTISYQPYDPSYMAQLIPEAAGVANPSFDAAYAAYSKTGGGAYTGGGKPNPSVSANGSSAYAAAKKSFSRFAAFNKEDAKYSIASGIAKFAGLFEGSAQFIIDNSFGTTLNPNSTVALKAPSLRTHSFSWLLAAKSQADSNIIQQIIDQFKANMLPDTSQERFFLNYPSLVYPEFIGTNQYLYTFKPSVITGFSALPVAGGQPSFFNDTHAPTIIQLSIQLLEVEMFLYADVNQNENPNQTALEADMDLGGATSAINNISSQDDTNVLQGNANE